MGDGCDLAQKKKKTFWLIGYYWQDMITCRDLTRFQKEKRPISFYLKSNTLCPFSFTGSSPPFFCICWGLQSNNQFTNFAYQPNCIVHTRNISESSQNQIHFFLLICVFAYLHWCLCILEIILTQGPWIGTACLSSCFLSNLEYADRQVMHFHAVQFGQQIAK